MNIADVAQHVHALEQKVTEQANEIERLSKQNQTMALDHIASEGEWCDLIGKKDDEIERLREALDKLLLEAYALTNSGVEAEKLAAIARAALKENS